MTESKRLSPSLVAQTSRCLHFYRQELHGDPGKRLAISAGRRLELERGREFEKQVVASLPGVLTPKWDGKTWAEGVRATLALIRAKPPWIHSAVLEGNGFVGVVDLLQRVDGLEGPGLPYRPVEVKSHKKTEPTDLLQVTGYALLLEAALGQRPRVGGVWLNTGRVEDVEISEKLIARFQELAAKMRKVASGQMETEPVWCSACRNCPWLKACSERWRATDHLSLLPNGGRTTVAKLYAAGIKTVKVLAAEDFDLLRGRVPMSAKTLKALWLHARARTEGKPIPLRKAELDSGRPLYFYDIETFGQEVFLHGLIRVAGDDREEHFFFAERPEDALGAWRDLLDYMAREKEARVLTWTTFENEHVEACWKRFGGNPQGYAVLRSGLEDQCAWVKAHFALPVRSYSIKEVAPIFGFHWQDEDAGGTNCEAWYEEWLRSGDPALREKILRYNRDDVLGMEIIHNHMCRLANDDASYSPGRDSHPSASQLR